MSGATRDPRIDPKPGDVIYLRREVTHVEDGCVTFVGPSGQLIYWDALFIEDWRLVNCNAEVIHVAD